MKFKFRRNFTRRQVLLACAPGLILTALGIAAGAVGLRVNFTASLPLGLWMVSDAVEKGGYVRACVPPTARLMDLAAKRRFLPDGTCASGFAPLLKPVVATEGDTVTLTPQSVFVNGVELPNTATLTYQAIDPVPAVPRGSYTVGAGEYWLVSTENKRSFDSRYFGALRREDIKSGMKPLLVFRVKSEES